MSFECPDNPREGRHYGYAFLPNGVCPVIKMQRRGSTALLGSEAGADMLPGKPSALRGAVIKKVSSALVPQPCQERQLSRFDQLVAQGLLVAIETNSKYSAGFFSAPESVTDSVLLLVNR